MRLVWRTGKNLNLRYVSPDCIYVVALHPGNNPSKFHKLPFPNFFRVSLHDMNAYGLKHNTHFGDEPMIENLYNMNRLGEKIPGGPDLTDADIKQAREAAGVAKI